MPQLLKDPAPPSRRLRWEITSLLVFKIGIILLAGFTIFGAHHRLHIDKQVMTDHLLSETTPSTEFTR